MECVKEEQPPQGAEMDCANATQRRLNSATQDGISARGGSNSDGDSNSNCNDNRPILVKAIVGRNLKIQEFTRDAISVEALRKKFNRSNDTFLSLRRGSGVCKSNNIIYDISPQEDGSFSLPPDVGVFFLVETRTQNSLQQQAERADPEKERVSRQVAFAQEFASLASDSISDEQRRECADALAGRGFPIASVDFAAFGQREVRYAVVQVGDYECGLPSLLLSVSSVCKVANVWP